jgi:hypothetical protein
VHGIIISRGIGNEWIIFIATANDDNQGIKNKITTESASHWAINN